MFNRLALVTMVSMETPQEDTRFWQTKLACQDDSGVNEAYLDGFTSTMLCKTASAGIYEPASELGVELGKALLSTLGDVVNK